MPEHPDLPEEALEALAKRKYALRCEAMDRLQDWEREPEPYRETWRKQARGDLVATAPAFRKQERERVREALLDEMEKARQGAIGPGNCINFGDLPAEREVLTETVQVIALADFNAALDRVTALDQEASDG